jgi:UDP-glucose 6-dehydrogenase
MVKQKGKKPLIGFIGQGFIGKNYADDFEKRGYSVVRYSLDEQHKHNGHKIKDCDIVFIAVPTPTTPKGFDYSIVASALSFVGKGKIAVIKSTVLPKTTEMLQKKNPTKIILMSPEFLTEATASHDAAHPYRNIVGMSVDNAAHREAAQRVMAVLPKAPFSQICRSREAEYIKYGGNNWFYFKILFINALYDLTQHDGCDYHVIMEALAADPRVGPSHLIPIHKSGTLGSDNYRLISKKGKKMEEGGRGAGGHCFIKDFAAFSRMYQEAFPRDKKGIAMLQALESKNIDLLTTSGKDLDILKGVYGKKV